jgi:hypothetical protein
VSGERLEGGAIRVLPDHRSRDGVEYRKYLRMLGQEYPLVTALQRDQACTVALAKLMRDAAARDLFVAEAARRKGRGRRPNVQAIERLRKRAGLQAGDYRAALERLERLCGGPRVAKPMDIAQSIRDGGWPLNGRRLRADEREG